MEEKSMAIQLVEDSTKGNHAMMKLLEGFPKFRVSEEFEILEHFKSTSR